MGIRLYVALQLLNVALALQFLNVALQHTYLCALCQSFKSLLLLTSGATV